MAPEERIEELLAEYEALQQEGAAPPFEAWARRHPGLEHDLCAAWADVERAARAIGEPRTSAGPFVAGQRLAAYELVRRLGRGGQGVVWEAEQCALGRRVALKLLRADEVSPRDAQLFAREARAGARLQHPGVVAILDSGEVDGTFWIAQELVPDGRTLRDRIEEVRRAPEPSREWYREAATLLRAVAAALAEVHATGIVHRDIKPQNILLTPAGVPKIGDFGLARLEGAASLSRSGQQVGTYLYMSPEQVAARARAIDHRTDVFSLGVVLYELLTLVRPFEGDTHHQVCERIRLEDPPDPRTLRSQVPADLACIAAKCLEKEPARRYPSMRALAEDLERHLAGEPILARPARLHERARKWIRRHPTRSAAGAVALVAGACLLVLSWRLWLEQRRSRDLLAVGGLRHLVMRASELWPVRWESLDAYEAWMADAEALREHVTDLLTRHERATGLSLRDEPVGSMLATVEQAWHELFDPVVGIASGSSAPSGPSVAERVRIARALRTSLVESSALWEEALARIRDPDQSPAYAGLELRPIEGLLPLGPDPHSGLWEFAHLASGRPAERKGDGVLAIGEDTGIVLVLLPGGSYWRGGQSLDPDGPNYDPDSQSWDGPPIHTEVEPFFLSKYEMTQGQWLRWTGSNPSRWNPGYELHGFPIDLRHPVDQVTWEEADATLRQMALRLPTEAEWEYGARAGTTTVWWTGDERESLGTAMDTTNPVGRAGPGLPADEWEYAARGGAGMPSSRPRALAAANLCDRTALLYKEPWSPCADWLEDGYLVTAPVDTLAANPFGLHHVHGNLYELTATLWGPLEDPRTEPTAADGPIPSRVSRGGSFQNSEDSARSSKREHMGQSLRSYRTGLRPALSVVVSGR